MGCSQTVRPTSSHSTNRQDDDEEEERVKEEHRLEQRGSSVKFMNYVHEFLDLLRVSEKERFLSRKSLLWGATFLGE